MRRPEASTFTAGFGFVLLMGALTGLDPLSIDMYLPAFPDIQAQLGTTFARVELSMSAFFIGMAAGQLIYGPLADRFGRRKPLIAGMVLYFVATLCCAFAPNIETFIALRVLQALGGCAGMVITRAVVRDLFEPRRVADFLSSMALVMGIAPIVAPAIGSFVNAHFGWHAIFLLLAAANLACLAAILIFLPETHWRRTSALSFGTTLKTYRELLGQRRFLAYLVPDTLMRAGMFAYIAGSPFVFIELFGLPADRYTWVFGANALGLMAASQMNRRLLRQWEPDRILRAALWAAALAAVGVFVGGKFSGAGTLMVPLFFFLATLNFVGPNSLAGALAQEGHRAGTASALYGCLQWSMASGASFLVSHFHDGTATPMTGTILGCGLLSLLGFRLLRGSEGTPRQMPPNPELRQEILAVPNPGEPGP